MGWGACSCCPVFSKGSSVSFRQISVAIITARKPHRCTWCGEVIPAGTRYQRQHAAYEGSAYSAAWHEECQVAWEQEYRIYREVEFTPEENERLFPGLARLDAELSAAEHDTTPPPSDRTVEARKAA